MRCLLTSPLQHLSAAALRRRIEARCHDMVRVWRQNLQCRQSKLIRGNHLHLLDGMLAIVQSQY